MNSNRLYNLFKSKRLDRQDIERYAETTDPLEKNAIEQNSLESGFESDAMEGWEELAFDTSVMSNLDQKFTTTPSSGINWYITGGIGALLVAASVYMVFIYEKPNSETNLIAEEDTPEVITTLMEDQQITLEESDVMLPEPIEQMHQAPIEQQVQPKEIKEDFKMIAEERSEEKEEVDVGVLEPKEIEQQQQPEIVRNHKEAKEIYLHDLKLVDYRKYRSKPKVKTRQMVLSGTPANMENDSVEEMDPVWKDVDVPYMEYLDKSVRLFSRERYKKALSRFETILDTYSYDVNGNFYAGLCLYNLGEYRKASQHFQNCIDGPFSNFDEEALWMKAMSLEKVGDSKAQAIYRKIANSDGFYAKQAKQKLK